MNEQPYDDIGFDDDLLEDDEGNSTENQYFDQDFEKEESGGEKNLEEAPHARQVEDADTEDEAYPPVKEQSSDEDDRPEITYYQYEDRKGGFIRIKSTSFLRFLPMFYLMPRELVKQRPAYMELPRHMKKLLSDPKYFDMVSNNLLFYELVADCYAWIIWQVLWVPDKKHGLKHIAGTWDHYSGYFPIWKLCYYIVPAMADELDKEFGWNLQKLFSMPDGQDMPWMSYEIFWIFVTLLTNQVVKKHNLQPTIDCAWEQRQPEDYNGKNVYFRDYQRSWNHNRKQPPVSMNELIKDHARNGTDINGKAGFDIPDPKAEFEQEVVEKAAIDQFKEGLSETDMRILKMRQMRFTLAEIAEAVGFKTASAVKKRIDRIADQYTEFSSEAAG